MGYRERINPKTGEKEFKYRYYFVADGKKKDSETAWFSSKAKAKKEGEKLKEQKIKADRDKAIQRRDKLLVTAFDEHIKELKIENDKKEKCTAIKNYRTAKAIRNKHMPYSIQNTQIKDVNRLVFRDWLMSINKEKEVSGTYIRSCRTSLEQFNLWLSSNRYYIEDYLEEEISIALKKTKIKPFKTNNRELAKERNIVTALDVEKISGYYMEKGLGSFRNFYYYTLFYTLFFSGMRVEELTALQWKFIDLRSSVRAITIENAITDMEDNQHALERTFKGHYQTKNEGSVRIIPIFDFYYELLQDYKESYRYEYGLSEEEMEDCFVFNHLPKNNPRDYMKRVNVLNELRRVCKSIDIEKTDLQMFRHSCATFLVLPPPNGLGYAEERVKDYFGHQDTEMLNKVYARLSAIQKGERMRTTFDEIYKPSEADERKELEKEKMHMIERIRGNNEELHKARRERVFSQIDKAIEKKQKEYYYGTRDREIVEEFVRMNGEKIKFVERT